MFEILDENHPWEITLPTSWEDSGRLLQARHEGRRIVTWRFVDGRWLTDRQLDGPGAAFSDVVKRCMDRGWRLFSLPMGVRLR